MLHKIIGIVVLSIILAALPSEAYTIDINKDENGNAYLINQDGKALYYFTNDLPNKSTCFGSCSSTWPPFYVNSIDLPSTLSRADFDYFSRPDGYYQMTYRGKPLYLYSGDSNRGDCKGDKMLGLWFIARP